MLHWGTDAPPWPLAGVALGVGVVAVVCELLPLRVDDNLTIPIVIGFATWAMAALFGIGLA